VGGSHKRSAQPELVEGLGMASPEFIPSRLQRAGFTIPKALGFEAATNQIRCGNSRF